MNPRTERAQWLGEQLASTMDALGVATRGPDAVRFLDLLARLEAYPTDELSQVEGLPALVAEAASARAEHAAELGKVAGNSFDLERLVDGGRHLPTDDITNQIDSWLRDVLVLATLTPWLSPARRRQAEWALGYAHAIIESRAEVFLDASVLGADRRALEAPEQLGVDARALLRVLDELPLVVAFDRAMPQGQVHRLNAVLQRLPPALLDAADDALVDHEERGRIRLPSAHERQALAAADEVHATLLRMEGGRWVLVRHRGSLRLHFEGEETDVSVGVLDGAEPGDLSAVAAHAFALPDSAEGLTLRLRVGPDSRVVRIDAHPR
ncbi:MAG: hypothetical protein JNM72_08575 [Deltaproteobacteria bacterium]|nr:hypothetical protein [Deltaproteobacteria bacterium]